MRSMGSATAARSNYEQQPSRFASLFSIGPYERNRVTRAEIDKLRNLIDHEGIVKTCKILKLSEITILRICAGFAHRLTTPTAQRLSAYLKH